MNIAKRMPKRGRKTPDEDIFGSRANQERMREAYSPTWIDETNLLQVSTPLYVDLPRFRSLVGTKVSSFGMEAMSAGAIRDGAAELISWVKRTLLVADLSVKLVGQSASAEEGDVVGVWELFDCPRGSGEEQFDISYDLGRSPTIDQQLKLRIQTKNLFGDYAKSVFDEGLVAIAGLASVSACETSSRGKEIILDPIVLGHWLSSFHLLVRPNISTRVARHVSTSSALQSRVGGDRGA